MASDEDLMAAYCRGDDSAFEALFGRYSRPLLRLMRRSVASPEDARELVQQTFLQLHRARDDFRHGMAVRPWLYTIALNLRRQHHRRAARRPRTCELTRSPIPVPPYDPLRRELGETVRDAVHRLPERQRQVIELHWFAGLPFAEIADRLGASLVAVKLRAHRGYEKLRSSLADSRQ